MLIQILCLKATEMLRVCLSLVYGYPRKDFKSLWRKTGGGGLFPYTLAMAVGALPSWQFGFSFSQWFLGLRKGSGPEIGQGIETLSGWLPLAFW